MAISPSLVGKKFPAISVDVERGRLAFFAQATGQLDPIYSDREAAIAAGHPDVPAPPTFLFGLKLVGPDPLRWLFDLGVTMNQVLHGQQKFVYESMVYAGETVTFRSRISDLYVKKGGALEFLVLSTTASHADGTLAVTLDETLVIRHQLEPAHDRTIQEQNA